MKLEFVGLVAHRKVALGHSRLGGLKIHLVASQPALVAQHQGTPDGGPRNVEVHIAAQVDVLPLVSCLDFSIFFPEGEEVVLKSEANASCSKVSGNTNSLEKSGEVGARGSRILTGSCWVTLGRMQPLSTGILLRKRHSNEVRAGTGKV